MQRVYGSRDTELKQGTYHVKIPLENVMGLKASGLSDN